METVKKMQMLLIEDNPSDVKLIKIYLEEFFKDQFSLTIADRLVSALALLETNSFEIIMIDLNLPDCNGIETFNKLQKRYDDVPIIVLTGLEDESIAVKAMKQGAQDFLIKGQIEGRGLVRAIHYSIERFALLKSISEKSKKLTEKTEDLQLQKQKLSEAQRLAKIGSWEWDPKKDTLSWSEELYRIHGIKPGKEEMTFQQIYRMVHPKDRETVRMTMENSKESKKSFSFYYRIIVFRSTIKTLHVRGRVIMDDQGEILKIVGTSQDVTERVIEEEMERLAMVASKSYNSVIIANRFGRIEWVNEGFEILTGYTLKDVKDTHGEILRRGNKTGLSQETDHYKLCIKQKKPLVYEEKNYTKAGKEYWVITTLTPLIGEDGEVERIIVIDSDITLRKQIEQDLINANNIAEQSLIRGNRTLTKLLQAKRELERSMKSKEQFLANMSHEIRTPMHSIIGFTDLFVKTEMSVEQNKYVNAIKTSCENLLMIINDILDFSKIQAGKVPIEKMDMEIPLIVKAVYDVMLPRFTEKKIKLIYSLDKKIPKHLIGDPFRLNQILINLVGNAVKFTEYGEVDLSVSLDYETFDEAMIRFSVSDTGIGIPQKKLRLIFDEFTQVTNKTSRKYGGNGLGLTIAKQLVGSMGGEITVKSKVGLGSVFSFRLSFKKNKDVELKKEVEIVLEEDVPIKEGVKILLVEDNEFNQMLVKEILVGWKWDLEIVGDGYKAIEKLQSENFDLVLMDIQLPELDGYATTQQIRNKLDYPVCNIPIVAITANAILNEEIKCKRIGMNGYISKPFKEKDLYLKLVSVLGNSDHLSVKLKELKNNNHRIGSKNVKETNLIDLEKFSDGNKEFIAKMISLFIKQTPGILEDIDKYLEEENWKLILAATHKMKPSVAFFGLKRAGKIIATIEDQLNSASFEKEDISIMLDEMSILCYKAISELQIQLKTFL